MTKVTPCPREDLEWAEPLREDSLCIVGENTGEPKFACRSGDVRLDRCVWTCVSLSQGGRSFLTLSGAVVLLPGGAAYEEAAETREYVEVIDCPSIEFAGAWLGIGV